MLLVVKEVLFLLLKVLVVILFHFWLVEKNLKLILVVKSKKLFKCILLMISTVLKLLLLFNLNYLVMKFFFEMLNFGLLFCMKEKKLVLLLLVFLVILILPVGTNSILKLSLELMLFNFTEKLINKELLITKNGDKNNFVISKEKLNLLEKLLMKLNSLPLWN